MFLFENYQSFYWKQNWNEDDVRQSNINGIFLFWTFHCAQLLNYTTYGSCFQKTHGNRKCYMIMNQVNLVCIFVFLVFETYDVWSTHKSTELKKRTQHCLQWNTSLYGVSSLRGNWMNFWKVFSSQDCNHNKFGTNAKVCIFSSKWTYHYLFRKEVTP